MTGRRIILFLIALLPLARCLSQGTDMGIDKNPGLFTGISAGVINPVVTHDTKLLIETPDGQGKKAFTGAIELGYMFTKAFGIRTGVGITSYQTDLLLQTYKDSLNLKDSENDSYKLRISGSGIKEHDSFRNISIPINIILNIRVSGSVSLFAEPGISLSFAAGNTFSGSSTFTYKGYYPEYNVLLENLPSHGFVSNSIIKSEGKPELKKVWTDFVFYGGLKFNISRKVQLLAGAGFSKSLTNISGYGDANDFHLSPVNGTVNSLLGGAAKIATKYFGYGLSLRYYINR